MRKSWKWFTWLALGLSGIPTGIAFARLNHLPAGFTDWLILWIPLGVAINCIAAILSCIAAVYALGLGWIEESLSDRDVDVILICGSWAAASIALGILALGLPKFP